MQAEDYIVHVDCQKPNANTTDLLGNEVACVDHHPVFVKTEDYKFEDIRIVGACASIVASYFQTSGVPMDEDVATALAYGIKMDTADFVRGTTAFDMDMMAYLFDYISTEKLNSMYNSTIEFQDLKAYGAAIEHIEVFDYVGFTYIPFECPNSLVAIISDFILSLDVVDVAVVYSINSDGIKFSVRSERADVDAGKLIYQALDGIGSGLPDTVALAVSKDLPFAHARFCTTEGIENVIPLSDFRCSDFDENYGVRMADGPLSGLLARAVIVVGKDGKIAYTELVPEITQEPDYEKAIAAVRK
jgi:hypothetical protein